MDKKCKGFQTVNFELNWRLKTSEYKSDELVKK